MIEGGKSDSGNMLTYGQIGGGPGSFIGPVHRAAIAMNGQARLVAGSFSDIPEETMQSGRELGLDGDRIYESFYEMAERESQREDCIDFVVITAPNHIHFDVAKTFLENGINVVCEKPLAFSTSQGKELISLTKKRDLKFMVTYTYTGYPMVREAREIVKTGRIGDLRLVVAEYAQDWLADKVEDSGQRQASWRTNPKYAGISCCVGDIGTHIENLVHFVTGLEINDMSASLETFVDGRQLDDNAFIQIKYDNGATGSYWSSQVAIGHENGLRMRVYGEEGSIEWEQENPNVLKLALKGKPVQYLSRGNSYLSSSAGHFTRLPSGHPEGYFEAFSNLYRSFCNVLIAGKNGEEVSDFDLYPDVYDGVRGIQFVEDCVKSSESGKKWIDGSFRFGGE